MVDNFHCCSDSDLDCSSMAEVVVRQFYSFVAVELVKPSLLWHKMVAQSCELSVSCFHYFHFHFHSSQIGSQNLAPIIRAWKEALRILWNFPSSRPQYLVEFAEECSLVVAACAAWTWRKRAAMVRSKLAELWL